jgi:hypothetical protein
MRGAGRYGAISFSRSGAESWSVFVLCGMLAVSAYVHSSRMVNGSVEGVLNALRGRAPSYMDPRIYPTSLKC